MRKAMKIILIILFIIIVIAVVIISIFLHSIKTAMIENGYYEEWKDSYGTIYTDLPYGDGSPAHLYDLYIPAGIDKSRPQALMLFIHGGSWNSGSRKDLDYAAKRYAKAGYITATMEYSLMGEDKPENNILVMLDEITECLSAIQQQGNEFGISIDQAALSGGSAGGHLALLYSYSRADVSPVPLKFVFEQTGPTDFHGETWGVPSEAVALFVSGFTGQQITGEQVESGEAEYWINLVSPAAWVNENTIPSLIAYAGKDSVVGTKQHSVLIPQLEKYNIPYTYIDFPNCDHPLFGDPDSHASYHEAVLEYAKTYFGY